jgi:hypothetical protein
MNVNYQDPNIFEVDYVYRIQTFEKYLENKMCLQEHYADYKA